MPKASVFLSRLLSAPRAAPFVPGCGGTPLMPKGSVVGQRKLWAPAFFSFPGIPSRSFLGGSTS